MRWDSRKVAVAGLRVAVALDGVGFLFGLIARDGLLVAASLVVGVFFFGASRWVGRR